MLRNISMALSKGFELQDENTLVRPDCTIKYFPRRTKTPYEVTDRKCDKRGNLIAEKVTKHFSLYAALRSIL